MHFLCLHGAGTNNKIFEVQTAALRYELGDQHTYEFVEGTLPWPMAPEITSIASPGDSYFSYFDSNSPKSAVDALCMLDDYILAEGPFDGVLAFSQGANLAAMHIIRKTRHPQAPNSQSPFKCLILCSAMLVHDPLAFEERGEITALDPATDGQPVKVPTVHIWGQSDELRDESVVLSKLCNQELVTVFVHKGGHEIPGPGAKDDVTAAVNAIRRGIMKAKTVQR